MGQIPRVDEYLGRFREEVRGDAFLHGLFPDFNRFDDALKKVLVLIRVGVFEHEGKAADVVDIDK